MKNKYINIFITATIIIVSLYIVCALLSREPYPKDIYYKLIRNPITYHDVLFSKKTHKYAIQGCILYEWPVSKELPNLIWDSTWVYRLEIKGHNNLTHPIRVDSVLVIDKISNKTISTCRNNIHIKDLSEFTITINVRTGTGSELYLIELPYFPNHSNSLDSLIDLKFNTHTFLVKTFTSVENKIINADHYVIIQ